MDALSSVLQNIHLRGSVYFSSCFCSPWGLDVDNQERASFHLVVRGHCWLKVEGYEDPTPLVGGDIVVLPHGIRHQIFDCLGSECIPGKVAVERIMNNDNPFAGNSENFKIVCGYFEFEHNSPSPLLNALPDVIHLTQEQCQKFKWLDTILHMIISEASTEQQGKAALINRATELLFIQVMRAFILQNKHNSNYFTALNCPHISQVLSLMHEQYASNWTLESLSRACGMSRSRFVSHFHSLVGTTPMKYLVSCRMQQAKKIIAETNTPLNIVAERVGYKSESAFKNSFKRFFGSTTTRFRGKSLIRTNE
ncbi:AraC family transcriptional regulator [Shewanella frigidimarina]|uniref:HTH araC/xylS-type domain-containing protein n=1 Tax=Shewanella frigidimarina TaxID=56812 RepID=A0A106C0V2_SHEFR|nr:AraC family transcriptional regulator [Shewanella frigidimarina]KVX02178.1 hypothetical protein AWJ07_15275 [Shewanella frigidimarina]